MVRQRAEAVGSIKIIRIDHCKGLVYGGGCHQNGVRCAPRLGAPDRYRSPRHELAEFLIDVVHRNTFFKPRTDHLLERMLNLSADNEHHFAEPGAAGIKNRIVHKSLAVRSHRIHLFQASIAASHASARDETCWRHPWFASFPGSVLRGFLRQDVEGENLERSKTELMRLLCTKIDGGVASVFLPRALCGVRLFGSRRQFESILQLDLN